MKESKALSRAKTHACKSTPSIVPKTHVLKTVDVLTCALEDPDWRDGNHIVYGITKDSHHVLKLYKEISHHCGPKPEKCHCKDMLQKVLELNPQVDRIDSDMKVNPFLAGCRCYLGVAARAGFRFIEDCDLASEGPEGRIKFTTNDYEKICETLPKSKCKGLTKIYKI